MNLLVFARYEIRRNILRRKFILLVAFTLLLDTLPFYALSTTGSAIVPLSFYPYIWLGGILLLQHLFLQFLGILISAGTMAEEYEQGSAELFVSKPVSRWEFYVGKSLGGYFLFAFLILLNGFVTLFSSFVFFGTQLVLGVLPILLVSQLYSLAPFFAVGLCFGELLRRSSLSYIMSSVVFFSSVIIGTYLTLISALTTNRVYAVINSLLPTSLSSSTPYLSISGFLPATAQSLVKLISGAPSYAQPLTVSVLVLGVYFVFFFGFGYASFVARDVTKRSG